MLIPKHKCRYITIIVLNTFSRHALTELIISTNYWITAHLRRFKTIFINCVAHHIIVQRFRLTYKLKIKIYIYFAYYVVTAKKTTFKIHRLLSFERYRETWTFHKKNLCLYRSFLDTTLCIHLYTYFQYRSIDNSKRKNDLIR